MNCIHCKKETVCSPVICRECYDGMVAEIERLRAENHDIRQLDRLAIENRPAACLGCGYEHGCSVHGCYVIKASVHQLRGINEVLEDLDSLDDSETFSVELVRQVLEGVDEDGKL